VISAILDINKRRELANTEVQPRPGLDHTLHIALRRLAELERDITQVVGDKTWTNVIQQLQDKGFVSRTLVNQLPSLTDNGRLFLEENN
jgi:hypothetical protein